MMGHTSRCAAAVPCTSHAMSVAISWCLYLVTHTVQEKQKAYRKLLREWHPDKNPDKAARLRLTKRRRFIEVLLANHL